MTGSFLARHRTICAVLEEIHALAVKGAEECDADYFLRISPLVFEAKDYAQRMSAKLVEYKAASKG